ncbi:hypothetical protein [Streptomyces prasinus]
MPDGWRNQQLARNLALSTLNGRERKGRAFAARARLFPLDLVLAAGRRVVRRPAVGSRLRTLD